MQEEMKFAALVANSHAEYDKLSAAEILKLATEASAKAYGLSNAGKIQEGCLADCILLNMKQVGHLVLVVREHVAHGVNCAAMRSHHLFEFTFQIFHRFIVYLTILK